MSLSQSGNKNYHWVFREWICHRELVVRREDPCKRMLPGLVLGIKHNRLSLSEVRSSQKWGSDLWKGTGEASSHCLEEATCCEEQLGWEKPCRWETLPSGAPCSPDTKQIGRRRLLPVLLLASPLLAPSSGYSNQSPASKGVWLVSCVKPQPKH